MIKLLRKNNNTGFTMTEMVTVIVIMAALSAVAVPRINDFITNSKIAATKNEMLQIRAAMSGSPERTAGGRYVDVGYIGDVGAEPTTLNDLITKPGAVSAYDFFSRTGWNGPYLQDDGTGTILRDAWENSYVLSVADSTIKSNGPDGTASTADDISIKYQ